MEILEKTEELNKLFSLYQELLTEKQKNYFEMYYHLDYSLQEIATNFNISRNAVYDQLKKAEEHLYNYEEKLKLLYKREQRVKMLNEYEKFRDDNILIELRKLDD